MLKEIKLDMSITTKLLIVLLIIKKSYVNVSILLDQSKIIKILLLIPGRDGGSILKGLYKEDNHH